MSLTLNFTVPRGQPLFNTAPGILDDISMFVRVFFQSGKRYTPQILTGVDPFTGRPQYISDINRQLESIGANWFYVDLNLEKTVDLGFGSLLFTVEVQNLLDQKNAQIINPATGRAYEYGDPTPSGYNDPLYPQLTGDVSPFPYSPARYLNPRTLRFSLAFRF